MKICHLSSAHNKNDIRIFIKECSSLAKVSNYEVHYLSYGDKVEKYKKNNVSIHVFKKNHKNRLQRMTKSVSIILKEALLIDADVYHFHDPELLPVGNKLKKKGKKVIYDVHEDVPRQIMTKLWIPKFFRKIISLVFEIYENKSSSKFTGIITATPHIKKRFIRKNENTIDIKNYPLLNELSISNEIIKTKKDNHIVYIGGITRKRGIFIILDSLDYLENVKLNLAGNFSNKEEFIEAKCHRNWDKVNFYGFVDRDEIKEILNKSKIGMVVLQPETSYKDSLPIKMFEYMAASIPVIASNFELWKGIISENNCGICVDSQSAKNIANAINLLIEQPEEAQIMGLNGRKAIETKYNWESESKNLIEFYNKL